MVRISSHGWRSQCRHWESARIRTRVPLPSRVRTGLPRSGPAVQGKYRELHRLLLWRQLLPAWQPAQSFARQQPLFLEIGFGNGEYLVRQALERPHHNFLGLELHWGSVRRTLRRLAAAGVDNVRVLQMDAHIALRYLFPDAFLSGFVALFPCPWPKRTHERFRLFNTPFMAHLNRALLPGCGGLVVTDHEGLMEYARARAEGSGLAVRVEAVPARYNTKYERRWSGQGQQTFYELHYTRSGPAPLQRIPEVALQTLKVALLNPRNLSLQGQTGDITVEFRDRLFDPERQVLMVLVVVVEDQLTQTFWIEAVQKDTEWHIRPAPGGGFLPTLGVERALTLVREAAQNSADVG